MLWGLIDVQRNPLELVKVKGGGKRQKALVTLTNEEFQLLLGELKGLSAQWRPWPCVRDSGSPKF